MKASLAWKASMLTLFLLRAVRSDQQSPDLTNSLEFPKPKIRDSECKLPACFKAAEDLIATARLDLNPCEDFYQYACGKKIRDSALNEQHSGTPVSKRYSFYDANKAARMSLMQLLADESIIDENSQDSLLLKQMFQIYSTCVNRTEMRDSGFKALKWNLDQLGLPMLNDICTDPPEPHDWSQLLILFNERGLPYKPIFEFKMRQETDSSRIKVELNLLELDSYIEDLMFDKRKVASLLDLLKNINTRIEVPKAEAQLKLVFKFASRLKKLLIQPEYEQVAGPITLAELIEMAPHTNWQGLIENTLLNSRSKLGTRILVQINPTRLSKIDKLLNETSPETLANFFVLPVVKILEPFIDYSQGGTERIDFCIDQIEESGWYFALTYFFVLHKFKPEHHIAAQEMIDHLKQAFKDRLTCHGTWLDFVTKSSIKDKLDEMEFTIGYPKELLDDRLLFAFYASLLPNQQQESEEKPDAAWLIDMIFRSKKLTEIMMDESQMSNWDWLHFSKVLTAGASYVPDRNKVVINAATILAPSNDLDLPHNMRYGALASVIAHEIWHGFDNEGHKYGPKWHDSRWSSSATKKYDLRADCFVRQYDAALPPGFNGSHTLGENIADNGAILTDIRAYKTWRQANPKKSERLPGVDLDPTQLFWVSWAMLMCDEQSYSSGSHSPLNLRINIPAMNSPEFSDAFRCARNAPMNPRAKCSLW